MKIKTFIFIALIGIILSGLTTIMFMSVFDKKETVRLIDQDQLQVPQTYAAASMSKGTVLMLLAVGIVGALGVSRTRKGNSNGSSAHRNKANGASDYQKANENREKLMPKSL
jgi:hypothetical protein